MIIALRVITTVFSINHRIGINIVNWLFTSNQSFKIRTITNRNSATKVQQIWIETSFLLTRLFCFLRYIMAQGNSTLSGGKKLPGNANIFTILFHLSSSGSRDSAALLSSKKLLSTPNVVARAFSVKPFGFCPDSMRCMVLMEMPDFYESSSRVRFNCSLKSDNFPIRLLLVFIYKVRNLQHYYHNIHHLRSKNGQLLIKNPDG